MHAMRNFGAAAALAGLFALPLTAQAQGVPGGAARGAEEGGQAAGPLGAAAGAVVGGVTTGVAGLLGVDQRPRFREYVIREHHPSFRYGGEVRIGEVLPARGVRFYAVPREYHVRPGYRYAIVNDRPVIVDPRSRQIVEIIE